MTQPLQTVTAVIANWNTPDYSIRSARALIDDGVPPKRIVVVDNGSSDDSFARFHETISECVLLRLEKNIGFARASNVGARALDGENYLFVNNDAFVHRPGSVANLLSALADSSVGVAVPRLLNPDLTLQPNVVPLNSPAVAVARASGLSRFLPNAWQPSWSTHWNHDRTRPIEAANGAVLLVRGETWHQLGGFEEDALMYAEDLDLCWRTRRLGWQVLFTSEAEFVHIGSATSGRSWDDPKRARMKTLAEAAMLRRQLGLGSATASVALTSVGLLARAAFWRCRGERERAAEAKAAASGYVAGLYASAKVHRASNAQVATSQRKRLLLVSQPLTGGVPQHVVELIDGLPNTDWEVSVACPPASTLWRALERRRDVRLHRLSAARRPGPADVLSLIRLLRLVRGADVIHAHSSKAGFVTRLAAVLRRRADVTMYTPNAWSFWAVHGLEGRLYRLLERVAARWCRVIVAVSEQERNAGLAAEIGSAEQYRIIPNGIDVTRFDRRRDPVGGRILFPGRLVRQKRPDVAVEAFARVREQIPYAELHLASDGPDREEVERLVARLGLADAVKFLGYRNDVPDLLARAACVLLTSDYEGAPLTVVEAMAAGAPLVATKVGGIPEVLVNGETGVLVEPGDVPGIAEAVCGVLHDSERARRISEAARLVAHQRFTREHMAEATLALYNELYESATSPARGSYASTSGEPS